jgi:hypothetical protein
MSEQADKPKQKCWAIWVVAPIAFFGAYMGAYYATVQSVGWGSRGTWHTYYFGNSPLPWAAHGFFAPAHRLDRQIRPEQWSDSDATLDDAVVEATRSL